MLLLSRIVSITGCEVLAEAHIHGGNPFFEHGNGLPAYVGLEMMAQAIAAFDGAKRRKSGHPAKIGFLLGCRHYVTRVCHFAEGSRLNVHARVAFEDADMLAFDCHIDDGSAELATASLKVYAPADPGEILKRARQ